MFPYQPFYEYVKYTNVLYILVNILFLITAYSDPGYVKKNKEDKFYEIIDKKIPRKNLCLTCENEKREWEGVYHCKICQRCVYRGNMHSHFLNNCIGRDNERIDYCFLITTYTYLWLVFYICIRNYSFKLTKDHLNEGKSYNILGFSQFNSTQSMGPLIDMFTVKRYF